MTTAVATPGIPLSDCNASGHASERSFGVTVASTSNASDCTPAHANSSPRSHPVLPIPPTQRTQQPPPHPQPLPLHEQHVPRSNDDNGVLSSGSPDGPAGSSASTEPRASPPTKAGGVSSVCSNGVERLGDGHAGHGNGSLEAERQSGAESSGGGVTAAHPPPQVPSLAMHAADELPTAPREPEPECPGLEGPQGIVQQQQQRSETELRAKVEQPAQGGAASASQSRPAWLNDPDYEVPLGTVTETQVLQSLAQGVHQPGQLQKTDRYGFLVTVREGDDGDASRRESGAAASSSGAGGLSERLERLLEKRQRREQLQQDVGRVRKWRMMAGSGGSLLEGYRRRRPEKVKRRVRKGIPDQMRRPAWLALSGGLNLKVSNPGLYDALLGLGAGAALGPLQHAAMPPPGAAPQRAGAEPPAAPQPAPEATIAPAPAAIASTAPNPDPAPTAAQDAGLAAHYGAPDLDLTMCIMRDLGRTFPTHANFMRRQGMGQRALFSVLWASAAYRSAVGYVQGLGFLAAVLLMYMVEEEVFWTLQALMEGSPGWPERSGIEPLYTAGIPGLQCCLYQFKHLLHDVAPRLAGRMEQLGVEPELYATHWFNTAFAYTLPMPYLLRVWDVFLAEGPKTLFRVGLAVLQYAEGRLLGLRFEALVSALSSKNFPALLPPSPGSLLRRAMRIPVSRRLAELRAEWERQTGQNGRAAGGTGRNAAKKAARA